MCMMVQSVSYWRSTRRLFQEGLGTLQGHKVSIHVKSDAKLVFSKARTLPYAYKAKVEQELEVILEPVEFAEWASPHCGCSKERRVKHPNLWRL